MNTKKIKEIGKWMMIIGSSIFTAGAGCYWAASHVERKEDKLIHERKIAPNRGRRTCESS